MKVICIGWDCFVTLTLDVAAVAGAAVGNAGTAMPEMVECLTSIARVCANPASFPRFCYLFCFILQVIHPVCVCVCVCVCV